MDQGYCNSEPRSVEATLAARGPIYGSYARMAQTAQEIKQAMALASGWHKLSHVEKESLEMIATKIARIVTGARPQPDSWHDVAGFARLAENACREETIPSPPVYSERAAAAEGSIGHQQHRGGFAIP